MLNYCIQSYRDALSTEIFDKVLYNNCPETDVTYFIALKPGAALIVFRGTDSFKDMAHNINFRRKVVPYGNYKSKIRVHTGFISAYKNTEIRKKILSTINGEIKNIYITGHSYGAALATLCAVDLNYQDESRSIDVVLFGSPRVGNRAFARSYNKRVPNTMRFENGNDLVTKLPFKLLGYLHVKKCFHIGAPRLFGLFSYRDHSLYEYFKNLTGSKPIRMCLHTTADSES